MSIEIAQYEMQLAEMIKRLNELNMKEKIENEKKEKIIKLFVEIWIILNSFFIFLLASPNDIAICILFKKKVFGDSKDLSTWDSAAKLTIKFGWILLINLVNLFWSVRSNL